MFASKTAGLDQENGSFLRRGRPGGTSGAIRGAPDVDGTHAGSGAGGGRRETTPPRAAPHGSSFFAAPYLLATAAWARQIAPPVTSARPVHVRGTIRGASIVDNIDADYDTDGGIHNAPNERARRVRRRFFRCRPTACGEVRGARTTPPGENTRYGGARRAITPGTMTLKIAGVTGMYVFGACANARCACVRRA